MLNKEYIYNHTNILKSTANMYHQQ